MTHKQIFETIKTLLSATYTTHKQLGGTIDKYTLVTDDGKVNVRLYLGSCYSIRGTINNNNFIGKKIECKQDANDLVNYIMTKL